MKHLLPILLIVLAGCASISDRAAKVQVHNQMSTLLEGCKKLGPITATVNKFKMGPDHQTPVTNVMRDNTADLGGDTLVVLHVDDFVTEVTMQGVAFKCY